MFIRLVIAFMILASLACSFSAGTNNNSPVRPTATTAVLLSTPSVTPTTAPSASATPRPTTSAGSNSPSCTVNTNWPIYVVVSGDTLGTIAQRTGSTSTQLAAANCLSNANQIFVGQQLRVPRQPDPVIIPTTPVTSQPGPVEISPFVNYDGYTFFVRPFSQIYIFWPDAARLGANQTVEFVYHPYGDPVVMTIGVDSDLAFDAGVYWSVPGNTSGEIWAVGRGYSGTVVESPRLRIQTVESVPGQDIQPVMLSAYNSFDGVTYRVSGNTEVMISWGDEFARTAASVEFYYYSPANPNGVSLDLDNTMMDGAAMMWTVPPIANGQLTARVRMPDGMTFETPRVGVIAQ